MSKAKILKKKSCKKKSKVKSSGSDSSQNTRITRNTRNNDKKKQLSRSKKAQKLRRGLHGKLKASIKSCKYKKLPLSIGFSCLAGERAESIRDVFMTSYPESKTNVLRKDSAIGYSGVLIDHDATPSYKSYQYHLSGGTWQGLIHPHKGRPLAGFINRVSNVPMIDMRAGQDMTIKNVELLPALCDDAKNLGRIYGKVLMDLPH